MGGSKKRHRKIIIVLRLSGAAGRDILSGIFFFTKQHPHWHTRLFQMPSEFTPEIFSALKAEGYDGIIASEPGPDGTARLVRDSNIPISFIGDPGPILSKRKSRLAFTRNDDDFIGHLGARYLVSLGVYRSYGFVPTTTHQYWSDFRKNGFSDELALRGKHTEIFRSPGYAGTQEDLDALKAWLVALPKPAAVMAAWDTRAMQILNLCKDAHIKVPKQIAILGVDNDELLDESCDPPLSSIMPNHEKLGFVAARELERLMSARKDMHCEPFLARPLRVVERESALAVSPAAHLLSRALDFIRKNATKGIKVNDVADFLGISRRLADLRFQQFSGESINETITYHKLETVKKLLATTNRPIKVVSEACGYTDFAYLKTLFKRRFGCTMREWRKANGTHNHKT